MYVCVWGGGGGRVMFPYKILKFKGPEIYIQELLTIILVKNAGCIGRKFALVVNFLNGIHYLANWPKIASGLGSLSVGTSLPVFFISHL